MNRYRAFGPHDDTLEVFGDAHFERLDMLSDPATLPAGVYQRGENVRTDANGLTVRGGLTRQFPAATDIGTIRFCAIYKPVSGVDQLALVTSGSLYLFAPATQTLTRFAYPAGETISAGTTVDVIQAGIGASSTLPVLYILRGLLDDVLQFDGTAVTVASAVPPAEFGLFYQNRLAVNDSAQSLKVSNFLDFTTFTLLDQFQIEHGGADYLVGLMAYQGDFVLIGARKKWFLAFFDPALGSANPYSGPIPNSSFLRLQTMEAGPLGKEAMLESAGLVWFVSDAGIFAFQPTLNNELVTLGRPLSAEIQPVFRRLSAEYAGGASIKRYGYRLYFALPISDEPVAITSITIAEQASVTRLPLRLPSLLGAGGLATVVTAEPHGLSAGGLVHLGGIVAGGINGDWTVLSLLDDHTFTIAVPAATTVVLGTRAMSQKLSLIHI